MRIRNTYHFFRAKIESRFVVAALLVLIICLANIASLSNEFQSEVEKTEITDNEFENDIEENEKTKESEKDFIVVDNLIHSDLNRAFLSHLDFNTTSISYYANIPTPPPDLLRFI